jgi:hypothetical protein
MKLKAIIIVAIIGMLTGCSKSPSNRTTHPTGLPPNIKDLGVVELSNHESHPYDLGNGKDCIVTFITMPDNNLEIDIVIKVKDAHGNAQLIGEPRVTVSPGHAVVVSTGDTSIKLMPKLKGN